MGFADASRLACARVSWNKKKPHARFACEATWALRLVRQRVDGRLRDATPGGIRRTVFSLLNKTPTHPGRADPLRPQGTDTACKLRAAILI